MISLDQYRSTMETAHLFSRPRPIELHAYSPTRVHATELDPARPIARKHTQSPVFDPVTKTYTDPPARVMPNPIPPPSFTPRHRSTGEWYCISSYRQPLFYVRGTYAWARKEAFRWARTIPNAIFDVRHAPEFQLCT